MHLPRKLASKSHDPKFWKRFHAIMAVIWLLLFIPTVIWWSELILWVAFMSLYANVVGHWSAYQAASAEKSADDKDSGKAEPN